jgi:hypothetical protein
MSHFSVWTKLETVSSNLHYYVQKQVQLLSLLSWINIIIVFLQFLNKVSTVIFCYLFSSALIISLNFPCICVLSFLSFMATFASLIRMSPNCSGLARVYCIHFMLSRVPLVTCQKFVVECLFNALFIWPFLGRATITHCTLLQLCNTQTRDSLYCPSWQTNLHFTMDSLSWAGVNWTELELSVASLLYPRDQLNIGHHLE